MAIQIDVGNTVEYTCGKPVTDCDCHNDPHRSEVVEIEQVVPGTDIANFVLANGYEVGSTEIKKDEYHAQVV